MYGKSPKTLDQLLHQTVTKPGLVQVQLNFSALRKLTFTNMTLNTEYFFCTNCPSSVVQTTKTQNWILLWLMHDVSACHLAIFWLSFLKVKWTAHSLWLNTTQYSTKIRLHTNIHPHREREGAEGDREERNTMKSWKKWVIEHWNQLLLVLSAEFLKKTKSHEILKTWKTDYWLKIS